jgi:hypothetical protein
MPCAYFFYASLATAALLGLSSRWLTRFRMVVKPILGHDAVFPRGITRDLADAFTPLGVWISTADRFFCGRRSIEQVTVTDASVDGGELTKLIMRCRVRFSDRVQTVAVTLCYPRVVLVLWCRDKNKAVQVLMLREDRAGIPSSGLTLPHGRDVNGFFKGGCLQQLRLETGLSIADATRVDEATLEIAPTDTNEVCHFYGAKIENLSETLDDDDDGTVTLVPLLLFAQDSGAYSRNVMFHANLFFQSEEDGYVTP